MKRILLFIFLLLSTTPIPYLPPKNITSFSYNIAGPASSQFGGAVAMSRDGSRIAVGSPYETVSGVTYSGAVMIYLRSGDTWVLEQTIENPSPTTSSGNFGFSVAMNGNGDVLAIGFPGMKVSTYNPGGVLIYRRLYGGTTWTSSQTINNPAGNSNSDSFGYTLSMSDAGILAAGEESWFGNNDIGRVYIFKDSSGYSLTETISSPIQTTPAHFGRGLCLSRDGVYLAVGLYEVTVSAAIRVGRAYVYTYNGSNYTTNLYKELSNPSPTASERYGFSVAIDNAGNAAVGAGGSNEVSFFTPSGGNWVFKQTVNVGGNGTLAASSISGVFYVGIGNTSAYKYFFDGTTASLTKTYTKAGVYLKNPAVSQDGTLVVFGATGTTPGNATVFYY